MSDELVRILPYSADLDKPIEKTELHDLFMMGDKLAHRIELDITRSGESVSLSGCTVTGYFTSFKADTTVKVDGEVENGKAVVTLSDLCYTLHGQFVMTIQISGGGVDASVFFGDGYMHASKTETIIYDDYVIYDVSTLLAQIGAMKTATKDAHDSASAANTAATSANKAASDANTAAQGASGWANATMTSTGLPSGSTPSASITTAADGHKIITLGIPKGDTGATPQISVEVKSGPAGSDADVSVSGTAEKPVIHLTIPRGETGAIENLTINGKPVESGTITLTAANVGALPSGGTAADASKLGGIVADEYVRAGHVLTVGPGCRFETINAAIEHARTICSATERVLIKIMPGVYDEQITLNPNPGIDFDGSGMDVTTIQYPSAYPNAPLFTCGQGTFRNLTLYSNCQDGSENPSYGVHVEYQSAPDAGGVVRFDHCKLHSRLSAAIGAGLGANGGVHMIDCICVSETANAVYVHGYPDSSVSGQSFTAHRCDFRSLSGGKALHIDDVNGIYGLTGSELTIECVGCMGGKMTMRTASETYQGFIPNSGDVRLSAYSGDNEFHGANYKDLYNEVYVVCMRAANGLLFVPWQHASAFMIMIQSVLDSSGSDVTGTVSLHSAHRNGFLLTTASTEAGPYWVQAVVYPGL